MKRDPEEELPILLHHAKQLFEYCDEALSDTIKMKESDHFGFMILCFVFTQFEHFRSVITLIEAGSFSDSTAISRMMLEGMAILHWVKNNSPEEKALLWRGFALVTDYKTIQEMKKKGENYDPSYEDELLARIEELGSPYLTKKARNTGIDSVSDPFQDTWLITESGQKITRGEIFREAGGDDLYSLYSDFSQWAHWTPKGLGHSIKRRPEGVTFDAQSFNSAAQACSVATHSMGHVMNILDEHFKLALESSLEQLKTEYLGDLKIDKTSN
ncbi:DUF5677 domain-containing protein [Candidatus Thiosymbion oneisti]|uniref:DUF5677 domain-containing protein n=1 Tax=Candidatus Thiosymbion oneisti TaxID=589554 RepID=UPI00114CFB6F|nr:DUF5677 domain-containing protein [Candidatus Thiosymbion oneisti]